MNGQPAEKQADPLLAAILRIVRRWPGGWTGTATYFLAELNAEVPPLRRGPEWPRDATRIGHLLTRLAPALAGAGVICARAEEGHDNRRIIRLLAAPLAGRQRMAARVTAPPAGRGGAGLIAALAAIVGCLLLAWSLRLPPSAGPSPG